MLGKFHEAASIENLRTRGCPIAQGHPSLSLNQRGLDTHKVEMKGAVQGH